MYVTLRKGTGTLYKEKSIRQGFSEFIIPKRRIRIYKAPF
jgi:hypothetical protein